MSVLSSENVREVIDRVGFIVNYPVGVSMLPLLRAGKDSVVVSRLERDPSENDVVLYSRGNELILHRIISVKNGNYIIRGDNCLNKETDVTRSDMLGVMTAFYRGDKLYDVKKSCFYRIYVATLPVHLTLRRFFKRTRVFLGRLKKRIIK